MNQGKSFVLEPLKGIHEFTKWTPKMELQILSATMDDEWLGNKVDGS